MLFLSLLKSFYTTYKHEQNEDNSDVEVSMNCCTARCYGRYGGKLKIRRKVIVLDLEVLGITIHEKAKRYTNECGYSWCNNSDTENFYHCIWISIVCTQLFVTDQLFWKEGGLVLCKLPSPRKLCCFSDCGRICMLCSPMVVRLYIKYTANDVETKNFVIVTLSVQFGVQRSPMSRNWTPSIYQWTVCNSLPLYVYCV